MSGAAFHHDSSHLLNDRISAEADRLGLAPKLAITSLFMGRVSAYASWCVKTVSLGTSRPC